MKKTLFGIIFLFCAEVFASTPAVFYVYKPDRSDGRTSSGEYYDADKLTVAHPTLPFGTQLQLNLGSKIVSKVVVNDRISESGDVFGCTPAVADKFGFTDKGISIVNYTITENGNNDTSWSGRGNNAWYYIANIKGDDLLSLYNSLSSLGYKLKYENDSLTLMYIVEHRLQSALNDVKNYASNPDEIAILKQEQTPARE